MANPQPRVHTRLFKLGGRTLALGLLLAVVATLVLPQSAWAIDDGALGIRPSSESDFFHLTVLPGEQREAVAIVTNHTAEPKTLLTYAVDGESTPDGAFALEGEDTSREQIGAWARLNSSEIVVPAESEIEVPFVISIPIGTRAGDYAGGLIIQSAPVEGETSDESGTPMRIDVVQRQGVRIYLNVPGDAVEALDVGDLSWSSSDGDVTVTVPVTNTGNSTLYPAASLQVDRWFQDSLAHDFTAVESVLPGATINLTATLRELGDVHIGSAQATVTSAAGSETVGTSFFQVPWPLLGALGIAVLALIFGAWRGARFIAKAKRALAQVARADNAAHPEHGEAHDSVPGVSTQARPQTRDA